MNWLESTPIQEIFDWFDTVEKIDITTPYAKQIWTIEVIERDKMEKMVKSVYVFGAGIIARAYIMATKCKIIDKNIKGCIVSDASVNESSVEGIKVYGINEVISDIKKAEIIVAVGERFNDEVISLLDKYGCSDYSFISKKEVIDILMEQYILQGDYTEKFVPYLTDAYLSDDEILMFLSKQLKDENLAFEVNIANHCNLNCQCCNHFSPLAKEEFVEKNRLENDVRRLHFLFGDRISKIVLLGGEPLLNPEIIEIMQMVREVLPTTTIFIYTNGLLLPKMSEKFWDICKKCKVGIKVTKYPINFDYTFWKKYANKRGVDFSDYSQEVIKTTYKLPLKEAGGLDVYSNFAKCYHANQCIVLREGRLYTCPISAWVDLFNIYFKKTFPSLTNNSIDIYEAQDARELMSFLRKPIKMCEYCNIYGYEYNIPWKQSQKKLDEWM